MSRLVIRWERDLEPVGPVGRPEGHLLGTLLIDRVSHHVEAFEVEEREGCQESVLGDDETSFGWRTDYVQTFVERDLPSLGVRVAPDSLRRLLGEYFPRVTVTRGDPLFPHQLLPVAVRKPLSLLYRLGVLRPTIFSRLFTVAATGDGGPGSG